jgi:hypothetical protein
MQNSICSERVQNYAFEHPALMTYVNIILNTEAIYFEKELNSLSCFSFITRLGKIVSEGIDEDKYHWRGNLRLGHCSGIAEP